MIAGPVAAFIQSGSHRSPAAATEHTAAKRLLSA